jgi:hypothetical protein
VVYGYDGWGTYYYRRRFVGCVCFWIWFVIVIIITGSIVGSTVGTRGSSGTGSLQYYYEQTSIVGKDVNFVCPILQLEYSRNGFGFNPDGMADLYALSKPPMLSAGPNITLESYSSLYVYKYKSWSYYMYEGTVASLDVCHISSGQSTAKLLMIRGKSNFNNWKLYDTDTYVYQKYDILDCRQNFVNRFTVPQGSSDVWYVVLDSTDADSTSYEVDILLYTQQYQIEGQYILNLCSVNYVFDSCTIPASNGATYLLSVGSPGFNYDYTDTVKIKCSCITNAGILAAVIVGPIVFVMIVITILTIILVCCCLKRKKKYAVANPSGTVQQPVRNVITVQQGTVIQPSVPTERSPIYPTQPGVPPPYAPAPSTIPYQPSGYQPVNYGTAQ